MPMSNIKMIQCQVSEIPPSWAQILYRWCHKYILSKNTHIHSTVFVKSIDHPDNMEFVWDKNERYSLGYKNFIIEKDLMCFNYMYMTKLHISDNLMFGFYENYRAKYFFHTEYSMELLICKTFYIQAIKFAGIYFKSIRCEHKT